MEQLMSLAAACHSKEFFVEFLDGRIVMRLSDE